MLVNLVFSVSDEKCVSVPTSTVAPLTVAPLWMMIVLVILGSSTVALAAVVLYMARLVYKMIYARRSLKHVGRYLRKYRDTLKYKSFNYEYN